MPSFKVHSKTYMFNTQGEIDFIDISEPIRQEVSNSGIKNGIVHVFAPHATGILILTENDDALLEDIKVFWKNYRQKTVPTCTRRMRIRICALWFFRRTRLCQ